MVTRTVTVIEDSGGGRVEREVVFPDSAFAIEIDGQRYKPAVTTQVEIEKSPDNEVIMDQCERSERGRGGSRGWQVRVQGIITGNDDRAGNLSLQKMRDTVGSMDEITIYSDIFSGTIVLSNIVITQASDLVSIQTKDTVNEEDAYEFQLQLGETESED